MTGNDHHGWQSRFDYDKAFYDHDYGNAMSPGADEGYADEYADDGFDYDDDEDIANFARKMSIHDRQQFMMPPAPPRRSNHQKVYSDYIQNSSNELSGAALDFTKRFIDMLTHVRSTKSSKRPINISAVSRPASRQLLNVTNDRPSHQAYAQEENPAEICEFIYNGIIGLGSVLEGPFGPRKVVYCDYVASGKPLRFIEQYIKQYVLPTYANTHSDASDSAVQTNKYREESRSIIRNCVNGTDDDIVIFTGSGSTAAIAKMIQVLQSSDYIDLKSSVVMVATYEHHSNLLSWENAGVAAVIKIPLNKEGALDLDALRKECKRQHSQGYIIIGSISAASNVTGIVTDTTAVAEIIHKYDGYAFFDYACGAPYLKIDMNPPKSKLASKDAVFISVHKFPGGPQSPGLLIAKKFLFTSVTPTNPSGGTVVFVSRSIVQYVEDPIVKEEGGTPEIIGSIRAGLAFRLKASVSEAYIHQKEQELVKLFMDTFSQNPLIKILGMSNAERLAIFSFVVRAPKANKYVHHNFIGLLLNDLFGVQSRPGCACAGPYAMELLDVPEAIASRSAKYFCESCRLGKGALAILKMGFVRVNLPFFYPDKEINFIIEAVKFVVEHGWRFLPQYTYSTKTGFWKHRFYQKDYNSLNDVTYSGKAMNFNAYKTADEPPADVFESAYKHLYAVQKSAMRIDYSKDPPIPLAEGDAELRWFLLPHEASYFIAESMGVQSTDNSNYPHHPVHQQSLPSGYPLGYR